MFDSDMWRPRPTSANGAREPSDERPTTRDEAGRDATAPLDDESSTQQGSPGWVRSRRIELGSGGPNELGSGRRRRWLERCGTGRRPVRSGPRCPRPHARIPSRHHDRAAAVMVRGDHRASVG
jgi:hypothetical protein